jgi:hypothetical protein
MLKKYILCIFLGFLTFSIHAQNFGGGFILGLNSSQVGGDNLAGFHKTGALIGIFANKSISKIMSFQMEMIYTQKGSNNPKMIDEYLNDLVPKQDISSSYVELPLLLKYHQNDDWKIEFGLLVAYLIDGYYNDIDGKISLSNNQFNPFINYDFGILLGIDYQFSNKFNLNTRLSNSIIPIGSEDYNNSDNSSIKGKYNSVLSFAIHYNLS